MSEWFPPFYNAVFDYIKLNGGSIVVFTIVAGVAFAFASLGGALRWFAGLSLAFGVLLMEYLAYHDGHEIKVLSFTLGFLGALGGIALARDWIIEATMLGSKFLDFNGGSVNIIVASDERREEKSRAPGVSVHETGLGQVRGATSAMRVLGRRYGLSDKINLYFSTLGVRPDGSNLVVLGGPKKNWYSKNFIENVSKRYPKLNIVFQDNDNQGEDLFIRIGTNEFRPKQVGEIFHDFALVVFWKNVINGNDAREILCAGLTSFGTEGAADWVFRSAVYMTDKTLIEELEKLINSKRGKRERVCLSAWPWRSMRQLWPYIYSDQFRAMKSFLVALEVVIYKHTIVNIKVRLFEFLEEPADDGRLRKA